MNILEQIATKMEEGGFGSYTPTASTGNIFIDKLPQDQDTYAVVGLEGGEVDIGLGYAIQPFKIMYRGTSNPLTTLPKASGVRTLLNGFEGLLATGGNYVVSIIANGNARSLGQDDKQNFIYECKFTIDYKE